MQFPYSSEHIMNALPVNETEWMSLYLKVLPVDLTFNGVDINSAEGLTHLIEYGLRLGKVERIDFSKRVNHDGSTNTSAYIHMFMWDDVYGKSCRDAIDQEGSVKFMGVIDDLGNQIPFMGKWYNGVTKKRFLTFKKNINPISASSNEEMNKDQLLEKCKKLEKTSEIYRENVENFIRNERSSLLQTIRELQEMLATAEDRYDEAKSDLLKKTLNMKVNQDQKRNNMVRDEDDEEEDGEVAQLTRQFSSMTLQEKCDSPPRRCGSPAYREAELFLKGRITG